METQKEQNNKKLKCENGKNIVSSEKYTRQLWLHIRILYVLFVFLLITIVLCVSLGWNILDRHREELELEIHLASRRYVEFNPEFIPTSSSHADVEDTIPTGVTQDEQLLRVKRRSRRHGHGETTQRERNNPSYIRDPEEDGSGIPEDWVWLTSYTRIPTFALQEFCAATQHHCPPGPQGPPGIKGEPGVKGDRGLDGSPGFDGANGEPGPKGERGSDGYPGLDGDKGEPGSRGEKGLEGLPGYVGPKGERGEKGEKGNKGSHGLDGIPGMVGPKGEKGDRGEKGRSRGRGRREKDRIRAGAQVQVLKGEKGDTGHPGHNGTDGSPGTPGPPGPPGPVGPTGPAGEPGFNGTSGLIGPRGKRGKKGDPGEAGPPGYQGAQGVPGLRGQKGQKGDTATALSGNFNCSCEPGPPGPPGPFASGERGPPGPPGPKGAKGDQGGANLILDTTLPQTTPSTTTVTTTTTVAPSSTPEPTVEPRNEDCEIKMVGKPVYQRHTSSFWGTWMKDPSPVDQSRQTKYWFTRHFTGKLLYEYNNIGDFQADRIGTTYELKEMYFGTGHVIYQGCFYFHRAGYNEIVKYDIANQQTINKLSLQHARYEGKNGHVYKTEYTYFDFSVDENGLWVIYSSDESDASLLVSKIDHQSLTVQKTWNISVNHKSYGNGFISCGILYLVKDTREKLTVIDFGYDLYEKRMLENLRLRFTNPFQMNNMISYDPSDKEIYSWDKGNQLSYPLLFV